MTEHSRIYILMARKAAGEASPAELEELDQLLMQHPELQYSFNIVVDINHVFDGSTFTDEEADALKMRGMGKLSQWLDEQPPKIIRSRFPWKTVSAAAASIALMVGVFLFWPKSTATTYANQVITKNGSKTTLLLPDGSSVVLNACSKLQYDANQFLKGDREVTLTGEAFFDVKHDPAHPFLVHSGAVNIRVLGTAFNVKAYAEDAAIETTLISGKVAVDFSAGDHNNENKEIILLPSQKLVINKLDIVNTNNTGSSKLAANFTIAPTKSVTNTITGESPAPPTAWMDDRFEFDNLTLEELSHDLERWYNVSISFKNDKYKGEVFTGAFKKQTIGDVLDALQITLGFQYSLDNEKRTVTIW